MTPEELRERQSPLKARYKEDSKAAVVTLRARGRVEQATVTCVLESGKPGAPAGLHPAAGGDGTAACSGELLLEALVSCAGVTLAAVATAMSLVLTRASVEATGDLDFRGTLGVARDAPVGFVHLELRFAVECDAPEDKLKKLVELTERYCVVLQTLAKPPLVRVSILSP
jgi:uncharacterized OsmC-like protein